VNYTVEMTSSVMIYIPTFIKIGSDIQKSIGRRRFHRHWDTQAAWRSHKPALGNWAQNWNNLMTILYLS
jgi:hypothetical protein